MQNGPCHLGNFEIKPVAAVSKLPRRHGLSCSKTFKKVLLSHAYIQAEDVRKLSSIAC